MSDMKLKFTVQPYQTEAVESVVNVFGGQPKHDHFTYRRDVGTEVESSKVSDLFFNESVYTGFANAKVELSDAQLLSNIHKLQTQNNIKLSDSIISNGLGICSLDVEMETGTGKTYVYIKTMFELNKLYGWNKFIVVVPSIAIREGVWKSFSTMEEHFMEYYAKKARFFIYDSKNPQTIDNFSQSSDINVMIINTQAFNTSFNKDKSVEGKKGNDVARLIFSERDDFGSRRPIDVIAANNPIIIMDEPQKMGGKATQEALKLFNPLFCLNYSATHKQHHDLVYVLDAMDAYQKQLVKSIKVKGFEVKNLTGTDGYLYLEEIVISTGKPKARLELEISYSNSRNRETRILGVGDDLFSISNNMEQYRGCTISDVDAINGSITFTNGESIQVGEVVGDVSESNLRRVQIRETIRSHFEKEKELYDKGIKVLSLFFIDEVAKYRKYDEEGNELNSEYGEIFEQEYEDILSEYQESDFATPYGRYLREIQVRETHTGYFSIDKKGHKVDSAVRRGSDESDDISAYDLILKDKETLLSFSNPVRFIFSHSALREGWDNPNVFQICTLKHGGSSATQKRQEVGRGLRLCVNQNGDRMDANMLGDLVHKINQLTVIASDGYKVFVSDLQKGISEDLYERPTQASPDYFTGKNVMVNGQKITVSDKQAKDIYRYLVKHDYIDDNDHVTDKYRSDLANGTLAVLPDSCMAITEGVHKLIQGVYDERVLKDMVKDGRETKIPENPLNDNFYKKEFETLWNYIKHKYAYTVNFDSNELIQKSITHINDRMFVAKLQYTVTSGEQGKDWTTDNVKMGSGFVAEHSNTYTLERASGSSVKYDLIGKIADGTKLTRKTVAAILKGIAKEKFEMFNNNPEEFISKAIKLIKEQKAALIVDPKHDNITYITIDGAYDSSVFSTEKNIDFAKAMKTKKNVQDYVIFDSKTESDFASSMELDDKVVVYAKLPRDFQIPTPVSNYAPDWAIVFKKGTVKHIFFIAETKGSMDDQNLKSIEQAKIACAKKLFSSLSTKDVVYHEVDTYENLLAVMESI